MTIQEVKDRGLMLFETISGSRAYGTHKPTSDTDYRGVFILPIENLLGYDYVPQVNDDTNDITYYEIGRFLDLLQTQNPNIIELFNMPEENILYKHPLFDEILQYKEQFLSQICKDSFGGYAISQIKKARGLNKKIVNPIDKEKKSILDFCYVIVGYKTIPLKEFLNNSGYQQKYCGIVNVDYARDTYALFYDHTRIIGYRGITNDDDTSNEVRLSSIPKGEEPVATMIYNKDGYTKYCKDYKEYWDWVDKRNDDRYNTNQEHGKGYDCYDDEKTMFLTKNGWKYYDQINDNDYLGTINQNTLKLEWEKFIERYESLYNGLIYNFENRYTAFSVTPNHKLFLADSCRKKENNFSTKKCGDFYLESVDEYFKGKKSHKHVMINCEINNDDYKITNEKLILFGLYISEGSLIKYSNNKPKGISLSQVKNGSFEDFIKKIENKYNIHKYVYLRKNRIEKTYNIYDVNISNEILNECSEFSENKKLPSFFLELSKRQVILLLEAMMSGDGHKHSKKHWVYYSTSKKLIEQLYLLLSINGYQCQTYFYENTHQLFISKLNNTTQCINKNTKRKFSWDIKNVKNRRIVCFTVPNGVLITNNNNKISFQGNSKNMMHCIRLTRMAIEIAEQKKVIVKRPDAEELLKIRNGEAEYEYLLNEAETSIKLLNELYPKSGLPQSIDKKFVNDILVNFRKKYYGLK